MSINPKLFHINQRLDVMLFKSPRADRLPSRVEEITPRYMLIAMPVRKGLPVLLAPETTFYGRVIVEGSVWQFTSTYIDKRPDPVPVWIITPPSDFQKVQLRDYVRLDTALLITVKLADTDEPPVAATTRDISGGGLFIATRMPVKAGARVQLALDLAGIGQLQVLGDAVRVDHDAARSLYLVGIKFVDISERERDKIIKYIFKKQLERRQKGFEV